MHRDSLEIFVTPYIDWRLTVICGAGSVEGRSVGVKPRAFGRSLSE